ncbi:MAG TPA: hypothetical protein VGS57_02395 [Thermoanaerobaculia bacterium]|jgi:hypothetical protein|nr:hypothetical protein [Thermoanaerobaculia bacterium]
MAMAAPVAAASRLLVSGDAESPLRLRVEGAAVEIGSSAGGSAARIAIAPGTSVDAFASTRGGWLVAGSTPVAGGRELAIWIGSDGKAATTLAPPPGRVGAVRAFPVPLLHDGELAGMAWLEGEAADRFAVRTSAWDGREWSAAETVAPPGRGSQLGLTGAVLADGSWLLAWSAFDGEDDEVMWSARRGAHWSAPAAVAAGNQVPDVTPALRADGPGALLAWSRYDGNDYRLVLSRFAGRRWQPAEWAAGAGTIQPRWEGETLTFRDAAAGTWVAARVDAADHLRATDATVAPPEPRPAAATRGGEPRLLFP